MIVEVVTGAEERPQVRVVDTDDLSRLHLAFGQVTDEEADEALREAGLGQLQDDSTGLLDAAALRAAAEPGADVADWAERWDRMVESARSGGWASDDGATLRVPIESAASG